MTLDELEDKLMQDPEYAKYSKSLRGRLQVVWIDITTWIEIHWKIFINKFRNNK